MSQGKNRKLVVVQLSGGNDYLNCIVPYTNPEYNDNRPNVRIRQEDVIPLDDQYGFNPPWAPSKDLYDQGKVAILHGVGYPVPNRSHFRSMDIWHTAEPTKVGEEGWLGQAVREMHPDGDNVVAAVNFGAALPRALVAKNAPVASVSDLNSYGLLSHMDVEDQRSEALEAFRNMYTHAIGSGPVMDFLSQTGLDALRGSDILSSVPDRYESDVEYAANPFAARARDAAQVLTADIGTRICYTQHAASTPTPTKSPCSTPCGTTSPEASTTSTPTSSSTTPAKTSYSSSSQSSGAASKTTANGTDHGSGGVAFMIGDGVNGGHYSEYPSLAPEHLVEGDLAFNLDFRSLYTEILEDWLEIDARPIVKGHYEKPGALRV